MTRTTALAKNTHEYTNAHVETHSSRNRNGNSNGDITNNEAHHYPVHKSNLIMLIHVEKENAFAIAIAIGAVPCPPAPLFCKQTQFA